MCLPANRVPLAQRYCFASCSCLHALSPIYCMPGFFQRFKGGGEGAHSSGDEPSPELGPGANAAQSSSVQNQAMFRPGNERRVGQLDRRSHADPCRSAFALESALLGSSPHRSPQTVLPGRIPYSSDPGCCRSFAPRENGRRPARRTVKPLPHSVEPRRCRRLSRPPPIANAGVSSLFVRALTPYGNGGSDPTTRVRAGTAPSPSRLQSQEGGSAPSRVTSCWEAWTTGFAR